MTTISGAYNDKRMHQALRSLPDTSLASHLAAALGRVPTVTADPTGRHALVALPSGACLFARADGDRLDLRVVPAGKVGDRALSLDELADLRLDLEILARAAELVELFVGARLRRDDFELAAQAAEDGEDEEEVEVLAGLHARARLLDGREADALVDLALALRSLRDLAAEHAEPVETEATAVAEAHPC